MTTKAMDNPSMDRLKKYDQPLNIMTLVAEDDEDLIEDLKEVFKKHGFTDCNFFTTGKDFVSALTPDVHICIVDHDLKEGLTGLTGLDLICRAKEVNEDCQAIVMTGNHDPKLIIKYINECGVKFWVDKDEPNYMEKAVQYVEKIIPAIKDRFEFMGFISKKLKEHGL